MEKLSYELKPYLLGIMAVLTLAYGKGSGSTLMNMSGIFLALACISILMLRHGSRNQVAYAPKGKATRRELEGESHMGQKRYYID